MSKCKSLNFESQREILKNYVVSLKKCVGAIFSSKPQIITKSLCVWLLPGILKRGDSFIFYYRHIFTEVKLFASHKSLVIVTRHQLLNTSHQLLVLVTSYQQILVISSWLLMFLVRTIFLKDIREKCLLVTRGGGGKSPVPFLENWKKVP